MVNKPPECMSCSRAVSQVPRIKNAARPNTNNEQPQKRSVQQALWLTQDGCRLENRLARNQRMFCTCFFGRTMAVGAPCANIGAARGNAWCSSWAPPPVLQLQPKDPVGFEIHFQRICNLRICFPLLRAVWKHSRLAMLSYDLFLGDSAGLRKAPAIKQDGSHEPECIHVLGLRVKTSALGKRRLFFIHRALISSQRRHLINSSQRDTQ